MNNMDLNITWLYPDTLNLHGDRGNVMALERIGSKMDLQVNITRINSYKQEIDFDGTDIIVMNPGEVKSVSKLIDVLTEQKESFTRYIEAGKVMLVIGTSGAVMAKEIRYLDGTTKQGLGYLDMVAVQRETVYGDDVLYTLNADKDMQIAGEQIQLIDMQVNSDIVLGTVKYGRGNNADGGEGAKYKNLVFTNALGPVLVKNPWYAEYLIRLAMQIKGTEVERKRLDFSLELKSLKRIKRFIRKKG